MLPPDTSSNMMSWHGLVFLLQVFGWFPYRMSTSSAAPVFSLPLCLWSIFLQIFVTALCFQFYYEVQNLYAKPDLGILLMLLSTGFMVCSVYVTPLVLRIKGNKLAALIHDLSQMKSVFSVHTRRWYCQVKLQFDLFIIVVIAASMTGYSYTAIGLKYYEIPMIFYWTTACCMSFFLSYTLFAKILDFLSSNLMVQTKTTVAVVSPLLTPLGSFNNENDLEEALLALHDLDAIVREVCMEYVQDQVSLVHHEPHQV